MLSILLALWNTWITYLFWIGRFLLLFTTDWLSWQQAAMCQQAFIPLESAKRASVHVQHGGGFLRIDSKAEGKALLSGDFGGRLLIIQYPWSWGSGSVLDWTIHLSDQIPLDLETYGGISTLELGSLQITDLKISANASETQISLPEREGHTTVNIEARTAAFALFHRTSRPIFTVREPRPVMRSTFPASR